MTSRSPNVERSSWLSHEEYISVFRDQAAKLSAVLGDASPDAPVPSCPDWTALDLVRHVVQVYAHKAAVLRAGIFVSGSDVEAAGDAPLAVALQRHVAVVDDLADLLTEFDPEAEAWTWMEGAGESTVGAWARRMAHEALIHRVDAELTAGEDVSAVDDAVAIDGVNEILTWMAGDPDVVASDGAAGGSSSTLLVDLGTGAWLVELGDGTHLVTPAGADTEADARMSGSPLALDLLLWGRPSPTTWGDAAVIDRLRARLTESRE